MEIEQTEKQFQMWTRFLFMIFGSSITLALISFGTISYGTDWPGFGNYVGGIWTAIEILSITPGFYLFWGKRWKSIPPSRRINTIFGYFVAGWISLLAFGFLMEMPPATDYYILLSGSAVAIVIAYIWAHKKMFTPRDEIFP